MAMGGSFLLYRNRRASTCMAFCRFILDTASPGFRVGI